MSSVRTALRASGNAAANVTGGESPGPVTGAERRGVRHRVGRSHGGLVAVAALVSIAVLATNLISLGFDNLRTSVINANWEFSWSHDLDTVLLAAGVYAGVRGARASEEQRRLWIATATIIGLFFLDEVSALHGRVGKLDKLVYAPILVALVVCVWRLTMGTSERWLVTAGVGTLIFAFGMHVVAVPALLPIGYNTYVYQVAVGFKEGAELAGLILLVGALWRRARAARLSPAS